MIATRLTAKNVMKMSAVSRNTLNRFDCGMNLNVFRHGSSAKDLLEGHKRHLNDTHIKAAQEYEQHAHKHGDHSGRQQNHIWDREEITEKLSTLYKHQPVTLSDKFMNGLMYSMYHSFNFITGYKPVNTPVKAMEWRLLVLESIAGVPGFVAAGFRHFRSLRRLQRDHGWIATLLEEAENERMHLLVCLGMFKANYATRLLVISAQLVMTPFLMATYAIHPPAMHRFVGYLEETACLTYAGVIEQLETPGTPLHTEWGHLPAPEIAISYWKLPADASFTDTVKCMFADECHHRDVNHTYAEMGPEEPSPFVSQHKENAQRAFELDSTGRTAWPAGAHINSPPKREMNTGKIIEEKH